MPAPTSSDQQGYWTTIRASGPGRACPRSQGAGSASARRGWARGTLTSDDVRRRNLLHVAPLADDQPTSESRQRDHLQPAAASSPSIAYFKMSPLIGSKPHAACGRHDSFGLMSARGRTTHRSRWELDHVGLQAGLPIGGDPLLHLCCELLELLPTRRGEEHDRRVLVQLGRRAVVHRCPLTRNCRRPTRRAPGGCRSTPVRAATGICQGWGSTKFSFAANPSRTMVISSPPKSTRAFWPLHSGISTRPSLTTLC